MVTAIWWVRRDLRLTDNPTLNLALRSAEQVIPLFIIDPALLNSPYFSERRFAFLLGSLENLDADLHRKNSCLVIRRGDPVSVLKDILIETDAAMIFAERDHSPFATTRDQLLASRLPVTLTGSTAVLQPGTVIKSDGSPYTVFTPFSKMWKAVYNQQAPEFIPAPVFIPTPKDIPTISIPDYDRKLIPPEFPPGEQDALRRLNAFHSLTSFSIHDYQHNRNRIDLDATSRLSPYLRFGIISPRLVVSAARRFIDSTPSNHTGAETWLNELIWRDFYIHILHHFPNVRKTDFRSTGIKWITDPGMFEAWKQGKTGYPIVDAAMRCLEATGWMHNRARMITASFLTKHLLINWQEGERWFMQQLLDGDPAANNGGWQWVAGTGTDAAPFFRIFNPVIQSAKFDPAGNFIRRWLPELTGVDGGYIHTPWDMPPSEQSRAGCLLGKDYPHPVIDHAFARQRALNAWGNYR